MFAKFRYFRQLHILLAVCFPHAPKAPTIAPPTPAPAPPTVDIAAQSQQQTDILRQRRGAASTVLAGATQTTPKTAVSALLGS